MRFVEIKAPEQQAVQVLHRTRMTLMRHRIELSNTIRAHMAEFGLVAPVGRLGLQSLIQIARDATDHCVPESAKVCLAMLADQLDLVNRQALENDRRILVGARETEVGRRLMTIPGVGPVLASAMVASVPDPYAFRSWRNLAAWIGLVPKQNSSGGKERLGGITKQGNRYLRQLLVVGALAVIRHAERHAAKRPSGQAALAAATDGKAIDQSRRRGARQQDGADDLGDHDQRPSLPRASAEGCVEIRR